MRPEVYEAEAEASGLTLNAHVDDRHSKYMTDSNKTNDFWPR